MSATASDKGWRIAFIAGLILAPRHRRLDRLRDGVAQSAGELDRSSLPSGLLVGFGTRLGGGCTSGHGICGIGRLSPRSIVATVVFMVDGRDRRSWRSRVTCWEVEPCGSLRRWCAV